MSSLKSRKRTERITNALCFIALIFLTCLCMLPIWWIFRSSLMMVFYGYSVMKNPRVWGDQGRRAVKAEHFEEYCRQNGLFFLKAGCVVAVIGALDALITLDALLYALLYLFGLAFAFYPLVKWCRENEGFSWPWPHVQSEKKRIKELRREQESQEKAEQDSDKK